MTKNIAIWICLIIICLIVSFITLAVSFHWLDYKKKYTDKQPITNAWLRARAYQKEWKP